MADDIEIPESLRDQPICSEVAVARILAAKGLHFDGLLERLSRCDALEALPGCANDLVRCQTTDLDLVQLKIRARRDNPIAIRVATPQGPHTVNVVGTRGAKGDIFLLQDTDGRVVEATKDQLAAVRLGTVAVECTTTPPPPPRKKERTDVIGTAILASTLGGLAAEGVKAAVEAAKERAQERAEERAAAEAAGGRAP